MIGNNGMVRALNLDENEVAVQIGGQGYVIRQQAKAPLMRILNAIFDQNENEEEAAAAEGDSETETETESADRNENIAQRFMKEWDKALPLIAMMLGVNPNKEDEFKALVQHLEEHLAPMNGVKIFKAWWQLNEIDDFFARMGQTILHPTMEAAVLAVVKRRQEALAETILSDDGEETAPVD